MNTLRTDCAKRRTSGSATTRLPEAPCDNHKKSLPRFFVDASEYTDSTAMSKRSKKEKRPRPQQLSKLEVILAAGRITEARVAQDTEHKAAFLPRMEHYRPRRRARIFLLGVPISIESWRAASVLLRIRTLPAPTPVCCQRKHIFLAHLNVNPLAVLSARSAAGPDWAQRMLPDDLRALTPLIYAHVTPCGSFRLDMSKRLPIDQDAVIA